MSKERVHIIGSGNVAWHFIRLLNNENAEVVGVSSRNETEGRKLAADAGISFYTLDHLPDADIIVLCIPDDAIENLTQKFSDSNSLVCHTSGSTGIEALKQCRNAGVIWPFQTLTKNKAISYDALPLAIEADSESSLLRLEKITDVSNNVNHINTSQRLHMHLAAVFANNFTNHMMSIAEDLCNKHNLDFRLLHPLLKETVDKAISTGPSKAQTGPAVRNDNKTIAKHLELLNNYPEYKELYTLISNSIKAFNNER